MAAGWALVFACAHFFWALGGQVGLAVSAGQQLAAERPDWFVASGLWGVGVLCLFGALIALGLARVSHRLLTILGWGIAVLLLVRGIGVEVLILLGEAPGVSAEQKFWTLALWNPWFILGGVLFALAARRSVKGG
ncbi:DUF3995 domain-containing protein [Kibdelosporangium philippinense]|uniref:DUF3995 domain-containing protein n=1 Tax=Kibdelosporangium philippinense TaxID=211113 RepID=A0ABS8ZTI6_9PSEU|nr:DUF3995 domain-containing protein [Kibdelosporangium philippinense]MCE7010899.1 DUF3995 domain-containing protein [Kibdelosporangium philippinense]